MNLIKFLNIFALIAKASKFLLITNELQQFRHFNEVQSQIDDTQVIFEDRALKKDD